MVWRYAMHYDESGVLLVRDMLMIVLKIAAPLLAAGMLVGLLISLFQSITSIQDQTLTFVPKIVAMVMVAFALLPWIVRKLVEYTSDLLGFTI